MSKSDAIPGAANAANAASPNQATESIADSASAATQCAVKRRRHRLRHQRPRGAAGDAPEPSRTMQARAELRDERMLKRAPADGDSVSVGPMPEGTYAFASPNALIATVEKGDEKNLPVTRAPDRQRRLRDPQRRRRQVRRRVRRSEGRDGTSRQLLLFAGAARASRRPPIGAATCPVEIPLSSLRAPKFVTSAQTLRVTIQPRTKDEPYVPRRVTGCPSAVMAK